MLFNFPRANAGNRAQYAAASGKAGWLGTIEWVALLNCRVLLFLPTITPNSPYPCPLPLFAFYAFAQTCPQLFGCSVKSNLRPTLAFFRTELGGTREEIRELVLSNPTLLRRVRPDGAVVVAVVFCRE